jgi:valyl-tRNA synthetase
MHPFMPFVTEELWQSLPWKKPAETPIRKELGDPSIYTLMLQPFPKVESVFRDLDAERTMDALKAMIEAIRNFRGENNISPKVEFSVGYVPGSVAADAFIRMHAPQIQFLARVSQFTRVNQQEEKESGAEAVIPISNPPLELRIQLQGLVDVEGETKRLKKEVEKLGADVAFVRNKLSQETFVKKAPPELVEKERRREQDLLAKQAELESAMVRLQKLKK